MLDAECRVGLANDAFYALARRDGGADRGQAPLGHRPRHLERPPTLRQALKDACAGKRPLVNLEIERSLQGRGRTLVLNTRAIVRADRPIAGAAGRRRRHRRAPGRGAAHRRRNAAAGRQAEGRVPRHPGARTAESAGPDALRARDCCGAPTATPVEIDAGAAGARPPGDPHGPDRRRSARRVAHHAGQGRTAQGAPRAGAAVVNAAVELCRPGDRRGPAHADRSRCPTSRSRSTPIAVRLTQVLVNLLNNAIKFTPPGGHIWLIAETIGRARPSVRTSSGSASATPASASRQSMLPKIFDMFMQGDVSLERTRAGLGVGLTLVRNLVALHGGTVDVRSDGEGSGSEFTVSPADRSARRSRRAAGDDAADDAAAGAAAADPRRRRQRRRPRDARVPADAPKATPSRRPPMGRRRSRPRRRFIPTSPFSTSACRA